MILELDKRTTVGNRGEAIPCDKGGANRMSKVKLLHGDCLELMKRIPDKSVDLTVTSPPYDNLRSYNGNIKHWNFEKFKAIAKELYRVTKQGGVVVWVVGDATIKGSETGTSFKQALYFKDIGFNLHDTMIYKKNGTGACGSNLCYWQAFEYMFVLTKGKPKTVNRLSNGKPRTKGGVKPGRFTKDGKQKIEVRSDAEGKEQIRDNVWTYNVGFASGDDKVKHPAKFPEKLAEDHILSWSNPGDIVFDPLMGSGTTGKMAVINGRNFIGIEIDDEYFEIAKKRIESHLRAGDKIK
jgi:DNA modification methylase